MWLANIMKWVLTAIDECISMSVVYQWIAVHNSQMLTQSMNGIHTVSVLYCALFIPYHTIL